MKDRNVETLLQSFFDHKTLGCADVFQVDAAKGRRNQFACSNDVFGVVAVDFDVEDIDIRKALEENALALHDGLARQGSDIAKAQHRAAVGDDGHQIALRRIAIRVIGVARDLKARLRDTRRIGQSQIFCGDGGLGGNHFQLTGPAVPMVGEGLLLETHWRFP